MIRILLVDDHASFRQPLAFMLEQEPDMTVVGQAGTMAEARSLLSGVDVAIVDLDLPDGSGMQIIPELRSANPERAVLVLTASVDRADLARALEAGAAGVLHKSVNLAEIVDAVRRLSEGELLMTPQEVLAIMRGAGRQRSQDRTAHAAFARLTPREREVLEALAQGWSDKEIAQHLHVGTETVRTHMVNILGKLGVNSRLQALVFALRHGAVELQ